MFATQSVNAVEDQRLIEEVMKEMELEATIAANPVKTRYGFDRSPADQSVGMQFERCGGGRRVIRKKIGSN